jgi:hypothetical protein
MFFVAGQIKHAHNGSVEGEEAVYPVVQWTEGEFEIDFTGTSDQSTITRGTTGLLMESMRIMDEQNSRVEG